MKIFFMALICGIWAQNLLAQGNDVQTGFETVYNLTERSVRDAIQNDTSLSNSARAIKVTVSTNGTRVTLRGYAISEDEKERVEAIAKQIQGVRSVDNRVNVIRREP